MPIATPTLAERTARIEADISSRLLDGESPLRRSVLGVLARALAGQGHMLQAYQDWAARQPFVDQAEAEFLDRHGETWGIPRKAAVAATGQAVFTGADGAVVPSGAELRRVDGVLLRTTAEAFIASGTATVSVQAVEAGQAANTPAAAQLSLVAPLDGVNATATVTGAGISGGVDVEGDEALRARILARIQTPPQGGSKSDYEAWALAVPGVTRAWVYPRHLGDATVGVAIVCDDAEDGPLPSAEVLEAAQAHLESVRPVTAEVLVFAPEALAVPVTLALSPDTPSSRAAVLAELRDLFAREAIPGSTLYLSHIREAISVAPGETNHVLTAPTADIVPTPMQMPVLGTVTFA